MQTGFGSLRRFNSVFAEVYGRPPTEIRRKKFSGAAVLALPLSALPRRSYACPRWTGMRPRAAVFRALMRRCAVIHIGWDGRYLCALTENERGAHARRAEARPTQ
jgi:hypothetical protein